MILINNIIRFLSIENLVITWDTIKMLGKCKSNLINSNIMGDGLVVPRGRWHNYLGRNLKKDA
jgi:hypothetical protein